MPALNIVVACLFYLVLYKWKAKTFAHKRIQHSNITSRQYRREIKFSIITLFIYAVTGFIISELYANGLTVIYFDIALYGNLYFFLSIFIMIFLHDTYFYWTHRLLHLPRFYNKIHITHHLSSNTSPWTALSFHPAEAFIQAAIAPLIVIIMPTHPIALFIFLFYSVVINIMGHSGFQLFPYNNRFLKWNWWNNSSKQHNEHHLYAKDNYGLYFTFWDKWMKTGSKEEI